MTPGLETLLEALPPALHERCRALVSAGENTTGDFVLYWMHHAVRGHENPALEVAVHFANRLQLPVLVYQGLGGRHPYNSDRHHAFILEGARDAHRELGARGIRAVFHLDPDGARPSPLRRLAARAAVAVFEDFPAPPFRRWTHSLAQRSPAPVVAVDAFCLVPMQSIGERHERAFAFRRRIQGEVARRLPLEWEEAAAPDARYTGELGFDPLDLEQADIPALCAACAIDHGVAPVAHTCGGSAAGYARWARFRDAGLARYAAERNDAAVAWPRGVSRLSPYLHHGHVSPFRIARGAAAAGGPGADKFLDELIVWRELAFNFCFHTEDPESLDCLPGWAVETLRRHAVDRRPALRDEEALARSASGDALWDLAQDALRIHGELHNNLRMTWAKAVPYWRPTPEAALATLIGLNHRYALDGSDPSSYGGLLWSLGLFDRPFPETEVLGRVRTRPTAAHARRLDTDRLRMRLSRPSSGPPLRIAVIGAGIAGLSAARTLHDHGHRVEVFEKSRGRGGRAATRRGEDLAFDHGAQYFTADDERFRRAVAAWREQGLVQAWPLRPGRVRGGTIEPSPDDRERLVAVPGMSALGRHLADGLTLHTESEVACLTAPGDGADTRWQLVDTGGRPLGSFEALVVAVPAPQAARLLNDAAPHLAQIAAGVDYQPTWAAMLDLGGPASIGFDGLFFADGPLRWAAHDGAKPGRAGHTWVLHAASEWTRDHLDAPPAEVADRLADAFCGLAGIDPQRVRHRRAHRWLYSLVERPLQRGALWDAPTRLAVCGDWCQGARIEGAYLSGQAAAGRLLGELAWHGEGAPPP